MLPLASKSCKGEKCTAANFDSRKLAARCDRCGRVASKKAATLLHRRIGPTGSVFFEGAHHQAVWATPPLLASETVVGVLGRGADSVKCISQFLRHGRQHAWDA